MNRESHDSKAIQTIHGAIQDINRYVSYKVIFEMNHDTYRMIHTILTTMLDTCNINPIGCYKTYIHVNKCM